MVRARGDDSGIKLPLGAPRALPPSHVGTIVCVVLVAMAIGVALLPASPTVRACAAIALLATAFVVRRRTARPDRPPRGWVMIDDAGVVRVDHQGAARVVSWSEPFGVTALANHDRSRVLLAFTTPAQTRYLGVTVDGASDAELAKTLLMRASTIADSDVQGARGEGDATLGAEHGEQLFRAVAARAGAALDRIYLTDARGALILLDGTKLRLGDRTIDLGTPLEWRGFMFQESGGRVTTVYQATWVRQGDAEVVLVAPMPPESSWMKDLRESARPSTTHDALAQRAVVRDLYLSQSLPEDAPPRDLRLAIDRLFMLPLRQALDRAPRISRVRFAAPHTPNPASSPDFPPGSR